VEVILLERIRNLGALGQTVKVKAGYGRNFLIPQGKAVYATKANIEKFEARRAELEKLEAEHLKVAKGRQDALKALGVITMVAKAGDEGKLFGSVGTRDIADYITSLGVEVAKSEVHLPTGALRHTGEYDIDIEFHSDIDTVIKLMIVSEGASDTAE
jgi:large subunit ribosomal protein L9